MSKPLQNQLSMFNYWVEKKGLEYTLEHFTPDIADDPAVRAALIQMQNAERALLARVGELKEQFQEDD
ncbi:hypothetical protein [Stutzerimonas stutzeri]|uniref:hypothetical protein n=1 Tax=Stutzerimonas stutzeri TaxID=316 RepID=UPI000839633C|nr:hypothetical protein [Stutzerimonas stutzeri]OCX57161.1 hypothetical protein BFM99_13915 [Stutzerimonas stutzeri]